MLFPKQWSQFYRRRAKVNTLGRCLVLLTSLLLPFEASASQPEEVTFSSGKLLLHGFIYRPQGTGPFPALLYNHSGEKQPSNYSQLAQLFTSKGYVVFVPHRRGHGQSQGEYVRPTDLLNQGPEASRGQKFVELLEMQQADVSAAVSYLKKLPYVDKKRIAMAGCSFGGIVTVLAAEKKLGLSAVVAFAPAAVTWAQSPELRARLIRAVRKATVPVLFIQAENDYDLNPTQTLAQEMELLGKPYKRIIFPAYGQTAAEGHGKFCSQAGEVWGREVFSFLFAAMKKGAPNKGMNRTRN